MGHKIFDRIKFHFSLCLSVKDKTLHMKLLSKILIFSTVLVAVITSPENLSENGSFLIAVNDIVQRYLVPNNLPFKIISTCENYACSELSFEIVKYLHKRNSNFSFSIGFFQTRKSHNHTIALKTSVIFILDSYEDLSALNQRIKMINIDYTNFHHFVIFKNFNRSLEFLKLVENYQFYVNIINYESFLYRDNFDLNLKLLTVKRFPSSFDCSPKIILVNEFSTRTKKWSTQDFGLISTRKLNKCRLGISYPESGREGAYTIPKIFSYLKSIYEYETDFVPVSEGEKFVRDSKSNRIMFSPSILPIRFQAIRLQSIFVIPLEHEEFTFLLPLGSLYTPLEKLLLPFDVTTWVFFILFLIVGFTITFLLNLTIGTEENSIKTFIFRNGLTACLNGLIIFFGQSNTILPSRSFPRYFLMLFIIYCLVIRTAFQGVQYSIMLKVKSTFS